MTLYMIIYVNNYDVGIEALPTPTITLLLPLYVVASGPPSAIVRVHQSEGH